jgi:hypothetical protein
MTDAFTKLSNVELMGAPIDVRHGYARALQELEAAAPLIEAARAYRDAKNAFDRAKTVTATHRAGGKLLDARDELCEAARTFEVSHEGQG